jgi:hypothetical protein
MPTLVTPGTVDPSAEAAPPFRALPALERIRDAFRVVDADWRMVCFNVCAERHVGLYRADVPGRTVREVFASAARSAFDAPLRAVRAARDQPRALSRRPGDRARAGAVAGRAGARRGPAAFGGSFIRQSASRTAPPDQSRSHEQRQGGPPSSVKGSPGRIRGRDGQRGVTGVAAQRP